MKRKYRNLTFIIILLSVVISFAISLYGLRRNNLRMEELRAAVFMADEGGNNKETAQALSALREHVLSHMNTDLQPSDSGGSEPPIQLPYKYYHDTLEVWHEEIREAGVDKGPLEEARKVCETDGFVISERLDCLLKETRKEPGFPEPKPVSKIYYTYNFSSPNWSPDLAGLSLVFFATSLSVLVLRLLF